MTLELNGRVTVYTNQVPYETDILRSSLYQMTAVSRLAQTILGTGIGNATLADDLPCTPVSPPGLQVVIGPGALYSFVNLDDTAYGVLPIDTNPNHKLLKQAINFDPVILNTPAPGLSGNSIIYLVQGIFQTVDVNNVSRPYFNSSNPTTPIFNSNFDTRQDIVSLNVKASPQAPIPAAPTPDAGYAPLYYVIVTFGQTVIVSGNISVATGAPFITESLTQKISSAYVGANLVTNDQFQKSFQIYASDISGSANVLIANPSTNYTAYVPGTHIFVKVAHSNTGPSTLNINSLGPKNIQTGMTSGLASLSGGEMTQNAIYEFVYDGIQCQLLNPNGASTGNFVTKDQEQKSSNISATDTGSVNAIVLTPSPAYASYSSITFIRAVIANSNTGPSTININGRGNIPVKLLDSTGPVALSGGEMAGGGIHEFCYNQADNSMQLMNPIIDIGNKFSILSLQPTTYQSIPGSTTAQIIFDNTVTDPYGLINSNGFKPTVGWWNFNGFIYQPVSIGVGVQTFELWLYKNGSPLRHFDSHITAQNAQNFSGKCREYANGTDVFTLYGINNQTGAITIGGTIFGGNSDLYNRFECEFVSF